MTLGSKENYINAATNYAWDELPQASTGGEACLTTVFGILLVSTGGMAGWAKSDGKILFWIKIWFLNIPRLWKFAQGDLGGILTWRFFLNSSRLLNYFRKMKYAMPCHATLGKIN
jgi:hypothetical protein